MDKEIEIIVTNTIQTHFDNRDYQRKYTMFKSVLIKKLEKTSAPQRVPTLGL